MQLRRMTILALGAAMAVSMAGCKQKEIVVSGAGTEFYPDVRNIPVDINDIDWDQIREDMEDTLNKDDYPMGSYIDFAIYPDANQVNLIWVLDNEATAQDAIEYGPVIMKAFNDAYVNQDNTIAVSTDNYYGGFWDKWEAVLQLYREGDIMDETSYYVNQEIAAGSGAAVERYVYVEPEETESDETDEEADEEDIEEESEEASGTSALQSGAAAYTEKMNETAESSK